MLLKNFAMDELEVLDKKVNDSLVYMGEGENYVAPDTKLVDEVFQLMAELLANEIERREFIE